MFIIVEALLRVNKKDII